LPPDLLRELYENAIADYWDESAFEAAVQREREEAAALGEAS
jgi:hypothetical protein